MIPLIMVFLLAAHFVMPIQTLATERALFRFFADVQGELIPDTPVGLSLAQDVIANTSNNFSDLRLLDNTRKEIPYAIYEEIRPKEERKSFSFEVLSFKQKREREEIVLKRPAGGGSYQRIMIHTPATDFKKTVQVLSGSDLRVWREITTDTIFDFSSKVNLRKTVVEFSTTDETYLKILVKDDSPQQITGPNIRLQYEGLDFMIDGIQRKPFRIDKIEGYGGNIGGELKMLDRATISKPLISLDEKKNSIVKLGRINLPLSEITFQIDQRFYYRRVEIWGADQDEEKSYRQISAGVIYRIPGMKQPFNTISKDTPQISYIQVKIINQDNPPLPLSQLEIAWTRRNLYFIPEEGKTYALFFGGEKISQPHYELAMILPYDYQTMAGYRYLSHSVIHGNPAYHPVIPAEKRLKIEKSLFTFIVLILMAILSLWLYRVLRKASHLQADR